MLGKKELERFFSLTFAFYTGENELSEVDILVDAATLTNECHNRTGAP